MRIHPAQTEEVNETTHRCMNKQINLNKLENKVLTIHLLLPYQHYTFSPVCA